MQGSLPSNTVTSMNSIEYDIIAWHANVPIPKPTAYGATLRLTNSTKLLTTMPVINDLPKEYTAVAIDGSCSNIRTMGGLWTCGFLHGCTGVTAIDLSPLTGVTTIGDNFLSGCSALTTVDLSPLSSVTEVGDNFVSGCSGLTTIDLSPIRGVTTVGNYFLYGCSGLTTIDLSPLSGVTTVGNCFLSGCSAVTTVDLRPLSGVTTVGYSFFCCCSGLTAIDLSPLSEVTTVGDNFLSGCSGLTTIDLSPLSGLTRVGSYFLYGCSGLMTVDLSPLSGVTEVGDNCLYGCSGLTVIDLSGLSEVTTVGNYFLEGCSGLTTIDLSPLSGISEVYHGFLSGCSGLTTIDLSPLSGVSKIYHGFLFGCSGLTTIDLSPLSVVTMIGYCFLSGCSGLTTIDLSLLSGVTTVGSDFLEGCSGTVLVKDSQTSFIEQLQGTTVNVRILPDNVLTSMSSVKGLGGGGQGTVSLFTNDESLFAVKSVPCTANRKALRQEYENLMKLNHPNIVRVMEYVENFSLPGTREPHDCIVMEYAELGSISSLVVRDGSQKVTTMFPEFDRWLDVALQTLTGLQALHGNSMHHNDLKPANILMTREGGKVVYKLADLGFGEVFEEGHSTKVLAGCPGTRGYMAPESIEENKFSRASDVYSWACTMGYVATGKVPRPYQPDHPNDPRGFTVNELMKDGTPLPHDVAEELSSCFTYNKLRRPTVEELIAFLKKHQE